LREDLGGCYFLVPKLSFRLSFQQVGTQVGTRGVIKRILIIGTGSQGENNIEKEFI